MNKKDNVAMVPKYRFPEFKSTSVWKGNFIYELADYENGKAHENDILENGKYTVVNSKFISTSGTVQKYTNKPNLIANKGDVLMVLSDVPNGKALAKCYLVEQDGTYTVNQRICRITPKTINGHLLFYLMNKNKYFLSFDDKVNQTNLSKNEVLSCLLYIPKESKEQQKIADCLSSIDELISAEEKKLSLLQNYKKGWMQKLFPAEGKTIPEWRFPEFKDSGEWETIKLRELADYRRGSFPQPYGLPKWYDELSGMPFIQVFDVDENMCLKATTKNKISELASQQSVFIEKGTLIVTLQGSIGRVAITQYDAYIDRTLLLFEKFYRDVDKVFLAHTIQQLFEIKKQSAPGGIIKTITKQVLSEFTVQLPEKPEQQKIANFLSGIDDLISKQTGKIEALKQHKQALMQGLFPDRKSVV